MSEEIENAAAPVEPVAEEVAAAPVEPKPSEKRKYAPSGLISVKFTRATVISGEIKKAGDVVEVSEADAKAFLQQGRAVLATE